MSAGETPGPQPEAEAGEEAPEEVGNRPRTPADLRMPLLGLAAWAAALVASLAPGVVALAVLVLTVAVGALVVRRVGSTARTTVLGLLLVAGAVAFSVVVRHEAVGRSPVAALAQEQAVVEVAGVVTSDPRVAVGQFSEVVVVRLEVREIVGRGLHHRLAAPLVVLGDPAVDPDSGLGWDDVPLGSRVVTTGRLVPADDPDTAGLMVGADAPTVLEEPDVWWRGAGAVRASLRDSVDHRPPAEAVLVPALVVGDDEGLDPELEADFATTGLTHLTAVSGTNLTLLVGFLLTIARWCGVRGRWLVVVAGLGIVGFLLLARTEPSVLRAAAMGTVGLLALGADGRRRGLRSLGVATVALLLVHPPLAVSAGFALSVLATAGIVVLAPGWRDAMARWLPRWLAEAIAVPAAAQLACTPIVAALSGEVSLVAVVANLLVAPVVGPATVLGLAAALVGLVIPPLAAVIGTGAAWCVGWIVTVAERGADVPLASIGWGTGPAALALLVGLCLLLALGARPLLRRPWLAVPVVVVLLVVAVLRWPGWGWPVDGWAVAACDIGQGDAIVLRTGESAGVVVDTGPDAEAVDGCLDRLGITQVPLVVLTHFHADHVGGLAGVLEGRAVGAVWTTSELDPDDAVAAVAAQTEAAGVPATLPATGPVSIGGVTLTPLWPPPGPATAGPGDGSTANDASVVLLAEVGTDGTDSTETGEEISVLLTGDVEPPAQAAIAAAHPGLSVDVLKVPHHGSRYQDLDWLTSLQAEAALVSAGADNDYGHPAPDVLAALTAAGVEVGRTDTDGDLLVVPTGGGALTLHRQR